MIDIVPFLDRGLLWTLVFIRITSAFAVMPIYGYKGVPNTIKIGLAALLSFLLLPIAVAPPGWEGIGIGIIPYIALVIPEIVIGVIVGMVTHFIFYGIQLSGQYLGIQIGFAIANVIDPNTEEQISIISQLQFIFAMLIFILFNGHHFLLQGIEKTFMTVPIGGVQLQSELTGVFVKMMGDLFVAGVKIAAPVMAALFLSEVALGIVARTVPQMNVFIVGFPLKIGLGMLALALSWPMFIYVIHLLWTDFQDDWLYLISLLGP